MIFKGGTSLSKVFKVIERFSEDIDVSIDRAFLGFGGANEPEAGASNKEKQRRIEALKLACQQKIANELKPALEQVIGAKLRKDDTWRLRPDATDPDQQTLLFDYPSSIPAAGAGYVRPMVKIEIFKTSWARYGEAAKGSLRVAPPEYRLKLLREDYGRMQQMFFGEPPGFDDMLALLRQWEFEFNQQ